jgi:hypothetical protein
VGMFWPGRYMLVLVGLRSLLLRAGVRVQQCIAMQSRVQCRMCVVFLGGVLVGRGACAVKHLLCHIFAAAPCKSGIQGSCE